MKPKLLPKSERKTRVDRANEFIAVIASCGREYFRYEDRIAKFHLDERGRLWFTDAYSQKEIYVCYRYKWHGFSSGGTLRSIIQSLRDYIRTGEPLWKGYFEPMLDGSCRWAYGHEAMSLVRDAAEKLTDDGDPMDVAGTLAGLEAR
jgi:hypothetical protein